MQEEAKAKLKKAALWTAIIVGLIWLIKKIFKENK